MEFEFKHNEEAKRYKAISLFAGAGGCSLGFSQYGMNILGAYDIWQPAVDTYNLNFDGNKAHPTDLANCDFNIIRDNLGLKRGELDLIIGGPPCQGYTTAGKRADEDPRNKLFSNYVAALSIFYPRWFMMENVEGMLTTGNGNFIVECIQQMINVGYTVCLKKVYMHEYGIPQRRKRIIIVGNREGKEFVFPRAITQASGFRFKEGARTLLESISDLEGKDFPEINHIRKFEEGIKYQRISALKEGGTMKDLPEELQHSSFKKRANRRVCDGMPSEKRGGAPSGLKRLVYDEPSLTITGSASSEFVHPRENRMLTVRECARIQTFPDSFVFLGTDSQQEQQIGNAIPPLFANVMADQIFKSDQCKSKGLPIGLMSYDVSKSEAKSPALDATCARLEQLTINLFSSNMNKSQKELYKIFSEHGSGDAKVTIEPSEVLTMLFIATSDLSLPMPNIDIPVFEKIAQKGFYNISIRDIESLPEITSDTCYACIEECGVTNMESVLFAYLKNLCDLYRRRTKYYHILKTQQFPIVDQIVPRSLLEYGNCDNNLLADWLEWRKWIFDIDNRSAQETGYVFEPILAGCLGGESVSAKNSPVKRIDDNGEVTSNGRQIDCYIEETREVYELKMRVTIAASGQGRFNEEMTFPVEAQRAGLTPILVVFDETESSLLTKLKQQYVNCGGKYYIGQDAWNILQERAGEEMGIFINKYIYPPINSMEQYLKSNPAPITLSQNNNQIIIKGESGEYKIDRE